MKATHVVHETSTLFAWKQLVEPWNALISEYIATYRQGDVATDASYWYGERACVSLLAGAAWRVKGALALQEYAAEKNSKVGANYRGRGDLWFRFANETSGYLVESKIMWPETPHNNDQELEYALDSATDDARRACGHEWDRAVGVVFVVPSIAPQSVSEIDTFIAQFEVQLHNVKSDALFLTFPDVTRKLVSARTQRIYPGIAMIARAVK
jgi:hypothetical protein